MTRKSKPASIQFFVTIVFTGLIAIPVLLSYFSGRSADGINELATESSMKNFGFYLEEVSVKAGVVFEHHSPQLDPKIDPILPQIASMGASVSVVDFDRDGWNDFYVTNSCFGYKNALYHNQKDGTFEDVAAKMGVADVNTEGSGVSMGAVWADYDNDGYTDLFIYKWGCPQLFKNEKGIRFTDATAKSGLPEWVNSNTAIWTDYNSDGYVDLFIAGYYREDIDLWHLKSTKILTESFEYAQNGGRKYLLKNNGNGTFTDVTIEAGLNSTRWTLAAGATDIDHDGYPELFIANDYGVSEFYFNDGGRRFLEKGSQALIGLSPKSGMNVSFGDTYNQGRFGIYISNITEPGILLQGNNFWVPIPEKGKVLYQNTAGQNGIEAGGWSYCAQFGDLNNDGFLDLYVANGYISGAKGTSYWYDYSKVTGGNSAIISDIENWPPMKGRSQSGYQENKIWLNEGSGHFRNVAKYVADSEKYDSRAVAMADLWNRGALDVIVANQNNYVLVYKNHADLENHWIAFELEGNRCNRNAIGATVDLYWDSKLQSQTITAGIGFCSQNQHRIQFGLGKNPKADKAVIWWPGGHRQIVQDPAIDKVNFIKETNSIE
jgi:enediyne biosynthesis protein E4